MDEVLHDPNGEIGTIRKMGITDFAIMTYLVRVREGETPENAFRALVQGRSLTDAQLKIIRKLLHKYQSGF